MKIAGKGEESNIAGQAVVWHLTSFSDDMDWDGFTAWLEADARHRLAYNEVALTDRLVSEHRQELSRPAWREHERASSEQASASTRPAMRMVRWLPVGLGVAAAAMLAIVAGPTLLQPAGRSYATAGKSRSIALADGTLVTLAPRSRLEISGRNATTMRLSGGAWFDVPHVAARVRAITAGPVTIRDIGTRFDVQADGSSVRVAVSQGHVDVTSQTLSQPISLSGGGALLFDAETDRAVVTAADIADIGGWRQDRLTYAGMPLALVADDLGRYAGIHLDVPADLRGRQFSGTLIVGHGSEAPRDLAQLMGLALVRGPGGPGLASRGNGHPSR